MQDPDDLALLVGAAEAAGDIALRHFRADAKVWQKAGGAGPVTEADIAVDDMLRDRLLTARPDYGWLSEESEAETDRSAAERVFIVDPIDGTRSFTEGSQTWAHALAVAERGEVTAAVVFLPARALLFTAALGRGASGPRGALQVSEKGSPSGAEVLINKPGLQPKYWPRGVPPVTRAYRPSLAYRLALVAEGRFDAMVTFRDAWEWDIAAGCLLVTEAGGVVEDRAGQPPSFNRPNAQVPGLLAGPKRMIAGLNRHRA